MEKSITADITGAPGVMVLPVSGIQQKHMIAAVINGCDLIMEINEFKVFLLRYLIIKTKHPLLPMNNIMILFHDIPFRCLHSIYHAYRFCRPL